MDGIGRQRRTVEVAGRRLAVEELRPAETAAGPALVLLHEGLGSIAMWRDIPARLATKLRLRTVVYDRWGYGGSDRLEGTRGKGYLHDEAEVFLPGLLDALGIGETALVGHSDGGTIALLFAAAFPERVRAQAVIAAHVFVEDAALAGIREAVAAYREGGLARRLARHHGDKTDSVFRAWADTWLAPWFRDWNIEDRLPRIKAPTLVVQGAADPYGGEAQLEAIMRGLGGPKEALLLPGMGHVPHLEAPEQVGAAVAGFLARHLGTP